MFIVDIGDRLNGWRRSGKGGRLFAGALIEDARKMVRDGQPADERKTLADERKMEEGNDTRDRAGMIFFGCRNGSLRESELLYMFYSNHEKFVLYVCSQILPLPSITGVSGQLRYQ